MKQVILVRQDLQLPKGKMAAQVAHAAVDCALKSDKRKLQMWLDEGMPKVVLKVADEKQLREYLRKANNAGLVTSIITDAGHTVVEPGTTTCLGIGPEEDTAIDKLTSDLKLM